MVLHNVLGQVLQPLHDFQTSAILDYLHQLPRLNDVMLDLFGVLANVILVLKGIPEIPDRFQLCFVVFLQDIFVPLAQKGRVVIFEEYLLVWCVG